MVSVFGGCNTGVYAICPEDVLVILVDQYSLKLPILCRVDVKACSLHFTNQNSPYKPRMAPTRHVLYGHRAFITAGFTA